MENEDFQLPEAGDGLHPEEEPVFDFNVYIGEVLRTHNKFRRRHGAPPLVLDDDLCVSCAASAIDLLHSIHDIRRYPAIGENSCVFYLHNLSYFPRGQHPVKLWYQQKQHVVFGQEPNRSFGTPTIFNFTQMVWRATRRIGVGFARTESKIVFVCHYLPSGNIVGEFARNVLPELTNPRIRISLQNDGSDGESDDEGAGAVVAPPPEGTFDHGDNTDDEAETIGIAEAHVNDERDTVAEAQIHSYAFIPGNFSAQF